MARRWTKHHEAQLKRILDFMHVDAKPFADTSDEAVAARKALPFDEWCHVYLPHWFKCPSAPMHLEADDLVEQEGIPNFLNWFRGSGKSTRYSTAKTLRWILNKKRKFIIHGGRDEEVAADRMDFPRQELKENPRIRSDYGDNIAPILGNDDATDWIALETRCWARGIGQSPRGQVHRGSRPDAFVGDDLEDDQLAKNPKRLQNLWDWIFGAVFPALEGAGTSSICCLLLNTFGRGCLADRAREMAKKKDENGRPLCNYSVFPAENGDGRSLWPERYPDEALARTRAIIGSRLYRKEMRCIIEDESALIRPDWIHNFVAANFRRDRAIVRAACDPSAGSGEQNDCKAIVVLARHEDDRRLYCLHAWLRHASAQEMIDHIIWTWDHFQPGRFRCEENGFQKFIWPLLDLNERLRGRIQRIGLSPITNTASKPDRLQRRAVDFEQGLMYFDPTEGDQKLLIDQWLDCGKSTVNDDGPDAMDMAAGLFPRHMGAAMLEKVTIEKRETNYAGMLA